MRREKAWLSGLLLFSCCLLYTRRFRCTPRKSTMSNVSGRVQLLQSYVLEFSFSLCLNTAVRQEMSWASGSALQLKRQKRVRHFSCCWQTRVPFVRKSLRYKLKKKTTNHWDLDKFLCWFGLWDELVVQVKLREGLRQESTRSYSWFPKLLIWRFYQNEVEKDTQ